MLLADNPTSNSSATPRLEPHHLAELRASGISDEMIQACGFRSVGPAEAGELLNWNRPAAGGGLAFPYAAPDGTISLVRLKLDTPRTADKDGERKEIKYEAPRGSRVRLYVPPPVYPLLATADPLVLTEGEKKAASAASRGLAAVAVAGVWCWKDRAASTASKKDELLPDFGQIPLEGRRVAIAFDSDAATNPEVRKAEARLAKALAGRGAVAVPVRLPAGPGGEKQGLDDFLAARGAAGKEEFLALADAAFDELLATPAGADDGPPAPFKAARLYLGAVCTHGGEYTLRRHAETFYRWRGGRYEPVSDEEVEAEILRFVSDAFGPAAASPRYALDIAACVRALVMVDGAIAPPVWLGGQHRGPQFDYLAFTNGILDLKGVFSGAEECLLPPSPLWFSTTVLDYAFDPDADCPGWLTFLDRVLEGDAERIALAEELVGVCLTPDPTFHKFALLVGDGANGKSVFCEVLTGVLGPDNVSHVPLESFGQRFQLTPTLCKLANVAAEIGEIDKVAEGHLKAYTAADRMEFDRKHKNPVSARPTARLILSTNNLPRFADRTDGLWRRILLLLFRIQIPPAEQDRFLADRLLAERPGILNRALVALHRLRTGGRFTEPAVCAEALQEYRAESNPARTFLELYCRPSPGGEVACHRLYQAYKTWAQGLGYRPLADSQFGREVKKAFGATRRRGGPRDQREYMYAGLVLQE